jgi:SAM-dependent methyltransferase
MARTIDYYNNDAEFIARRMDGLDVSHLVDRFVGSLAQRGKGLRVLELGTGSGRDAARILAAGCDLLTCDGSAGMLQAAEGLHPELAGRTRELMLAPDEAGLIRLPFADASFDGIYSVATIMHIEREYLASLFEELARVLMPGGLLAYSVNTARNELDAAGTDPHRRHFTVLSLEGWEALHTRVGLVTELADEAPDAAGRPGIRWGSFHARKP